MGKILSWVALFALVYAGMRLFVIFQRKSQAAALARARREQSTNGEDGGRPDPAAEGKALGESMLACAHCGVYAPASEMLRVRGRVFCSAEHRDADGA